MPTRPLALAPLLAIALSGCGPSAGPRPDDRLPGPRLVTLSIVGTNDLHGHLEALPAFSGYLANLRAVRAADRGAVVLLDGGDMFQGTLESNLAEGAPIVQAYAVLGYDAVTVGNHEFDYGPVGDRATPASPEDDRRGALRARVAEAPYPFLSANLLDRATRERAELGTAEHPVLPTVVLERAGVRIGVVGVTTEQTLTTTIAVNVDDLAMMPLAEAVSLHAAALRESGVDLVLVAAHAGGRCAHFEAPEDLSSCDPEQEIMELAGALAPGTVDAIVAGHTHQGMAHVVEGIAIIESFSYGRSFGRIDLTFDLDRRRVVARQILPPTDICQPDACASATYEGRGIEADPRIASITAQATAVAAERRASPLGVMLATEIPSDGGEESALGNLFTDLMRAARPEADVAIYNGGGLRADLPAGPLTYGAFYQALPFDNRFAFVRMTVGDLAAMLTRNAVRRSSFLSVSGVHVEVGCASGGGGVRVTLARADGTALGDDEPLTVVVSDFLALGGDDVLERVREREGAVRIEDGAPMREAMVEILRRRGGTLSASELFDPARPRVTLPGPRPVRCD